MKPIVLFAIDIETINNALESVGYPEGLKNDNLWNFIHYLDSCSWGELDDVNERIANSIRTHYADWIIKQP